MSKTSMESRWTAGITLESDKVQHTLPHERAIEAVHAERAAAVEESGRDDETCKVEDSSHEKENP